MRPASSNPTFTRRPTKVSLLTAAGCVLLGACGPDNDLTAIEATSVFEAATDEVGASYVDTYSNGGTFDSESRCSGGGTVAIESRGFGDSDDLLGDILGAYADEALYGFDADLDDCVSDGLTLNGSMNVGLDLGLLDPFSGTVEVTAAVWAQGNGIDGSCGVDINLAYDLDLFDLDLSELSAIFETGWDTPLPFDTNVEQTSSGSAEICGEESAALAEQMAERFALAVVSGAL